jgi:hypothetical protein
MAIPSSGAISLSTVQTEFGGSNPISLSEYYAGGTYVAAGTTGTYGAVPSSGTISLRNFYGTSDYIVPTISLANHDLVGTADDVVALTTSVHFVLDSGGMSKVDFASTSFSCDVTVDTVSQGTAGIYNIEQWLDGGLNSDVAVYVTQTSGSTLTVGSSALNTYLNLGTTRQWGLSTTRSSLGFASKACTLSFTFVEATNTSNVLDTATITIQASASFTT